VEENTADGIKAKLVSCICPIVFMGLPVNIMAFLSVDRKDKNENDKTHLLGVNFCAYLLRSKYGYIRPKPMRQMLCLRIA